ncbi:MAG: hypothetical protein HPY69_15675 [Armatimonadetes bacterium]|nr:hypothetical protein [Armatimonadota bacterium]
MRCATRRKLADYEVGLLSAAETESVARHLERCAGCRQELAALRRTQTLLTAAPQSDPPEDLWPAIRVALASHRPQRRGLTPAWTPAMAVALALVLVIGALWLVPSLQHQALPLAPVGDGDTVAEVQLAAAWNAPLADQAALGLAMLATMDEEWPLEAVD